VTNHTTFITGLVELVALTLSLAGVVCQTSLTYQLQICRTAQALPWQWSSASVARIMTIFTSLTCVVAELVSRTLLTSASCSIQVGWLAVTCQTVARQRAIALPARGITLKTSFHHFVCIIPVFASLTISIQGYQVIVYGIARSAIPRHRSNTGLAELIAGLACPSVCILSIQTPYARAIIAYSSYKIKVIVCLISTTKTVILLWTIADRARGMTWPTRLSLFISVKEFRANITFSSKI